MLLSTNLEKKLIFDHFAELLSVKGCLNVASVLGDGLEKNLEENRFLFFCNFSQFFEAGAIFCRASNKTNFFKSFSNFIFGLFLHVIVVCRLPVWPI